MYKFLILWTTDWLHPCYMETIANMSESIGAQSYRNDEEHINIKTCQDTVTFDILQGKKFSLGSFENIPSTTC